MKFIVTDGFDIGRYVIVEVEVPEDFPGNVDALQIAASDGVERLANEYPDDYRCRDCERPSISDIHVYPIPDAPQEVFTVSHFIDRKEPS